MHAIEIKLYFRPCDKLKGLFQELFIAFLGMTALKKAPISPSIILYRA